MKSDMLNSLMHISLNGPDSISPECSTFIKQCVHVRLSSAKRKKLPPAMANTTQFFEQAGQFVHSHKMTTFENQGTQTESVETDPAFVVEREVSVAASALGLSGSDNESESEFSDYFSGSDSE